MVIIAPKTLDRKAKRANVIFVPHRNDPKAPKPPHPRKPLKPASGSHLSHEKGQRRSRQIRSAGSALHQLLLGAPMCLKYRALRALREKGPLGLGLGGRNVSPNMELTWTRERNRLSTPEDEYPTSGAGGNFFGLGGFGVMTVQSVPL